MICPKCGERMGITHAYEVNNSSKTQRMECPACCMVCTAVTITAIVVVDPGYGQGANVLAQKIAERSVKTIQKAIVALSPNKKPG